MTDLLASSPEDGTDDDHDAAGLLVSRARTVRLLNLTELSIKQTRTLLVPLNTEPGTRGDNIGLKPI